MDIKVNTTQPVVPTDTTTKVSESDSGFKFTLISHIEEKDLQGEASITVEHVQNNVTVRDMLGQRGIRPEDLPASEDIKKLERRVKSQEKNLAAQSAKLPQL